MKLLWDYLKSRRMLFLALLIILAIFILIFALYRLPPAALLYPSLLCLIPGGLFLALDFAKVRKRHIQMKQISDLAAGIMPEFPEPTGVSEADDLEILESLKRQVLELERQYEAREQDRADYFTVWVHQIKTPIAAMRLTLQNEDCPAERRLLADLFRIEQYVEMALAFLRLDSVSGGDYVFRPCDVDEVIRRALSKFSAEFIERRLYLDYTPVNFTAVTDEKWLAFLIEQILSNALKYTKEGGIRIDSDAKNRVRIADSGIGIAPEDLPRVFEKGYTGKNGRIDLRASGLGLYLCKRVCANLSIDIGIDSKPGEGTCVSLCFEQDRGKKE